MEKESITMKTKEELNALKEEVEALNKKLAELTEEELAQVSGGKTLGIKQTEPIGVRCGGKIFIEWWN